MRKLLVLFVALLCSIQFAYAASTANVQIRVSGEQYNRYFLCVIHMGCLSIRGGEEGKIYRFYEPIQIGTMFITDVLQHFRVYPQPTPSSCRVNLKPGHTLTIYGNLVGTYGGGVRIDGLYCTYR